MGKMPIGQHFSYQSNQHIKGKMLIKIK